MKVETIKNVQFDFAIAKDINVFQMNITIVKAWTFVCLIEKWKSDHISMFMFEKNIFSLLELIIITIAKIIGHSKETPNLRL